MSLPKKNKTPASFDPKLHGGKRKKHEESHGGGGGHDESNWLVSYADMMTLLCGFFIMLFSMAKLDDPKYEKVKEEVAKQFGGKYEAPPIEKMGKELSSTATQIFKEAGVEKSVALKTDPSGLTIAFQSTLFFDSLSAEVKPEGRAVIDKVIASIAAQQNKDQKNYKIVVEGHTDARPITGGAFPSNWELSGARASRVVRLFLDKGFAPDHLTSIGYADTRPVAESRYANGTWCEENLGKNRRVVLRIMEPQADSKPIDHLEPAVASTTEVKTGATEIPERAPAAAPQTLPEP
jgi:chemotaxis protein MotB